MIDSDSPIALLEFQKIAVYVCLASNYAHIHHVRFFFDIYIAHIAQGLIYSRAENRSI